MPHSPCASVAAGTLSHNAVMYRVEPRKYAMWHRGLPFLCAARGVEAKVPLGSVLAWTGQEVAWFFSGGLRSLPCDTEGICRDVR